MKINFKKPEIKIGRKKAASEPSAFDTNAGGIVFGAPSEFGISTGFGIGDDTDSFGVNVRNEAAAINLLDEKATDSWWKRELPHEIATAAALVSFFSFMLAAAEMATEIPFLLAGVVLYMVFVVLEEKLDSRIKLIATASTGAVLVILAIVLRTYIIGGLGDIMNCVYEASEAEQAYIYTKFNISEAAQSNPDICIRAAAAWASCLIASLGAMPPAAARRFIGLGVAVFAFIAFAYYGLVPSAVVVALLVVAIMFVLARGGLLSALPVLLAALLFFGAIVLISPGENYGISKADERIRDRLAFRSAYLETERNIENPTENETQTNNDNNTENEKDKESEVSLKWLVPLIITVLIIAALAGIAYLMYKRYLRRRDANREGLDSEDIRTAIIAMFPYAVRWLGVSGVEVSGRNFASLVEPLKRDISDQYSNYFSSMYVLWREAAYSDHGMEEEQKEAMWTFVNDTVDMVNNTLDWKGKIKNTFKYAL